MAFGTAGLTAMLATMALEDSGLTPETDKPVLVTGAGGGVSAVTIALLAALGYTVTAVTGRPLLEPWLRALGATDILPRAALATATNKPLESETWAGCVDAVGGTTLSRLLGQMGYTAPRWRRVGWRAARR